MKKIMLLVALFLLSVLLSNYIANAHEWYDRDCCDNKDCTPVIKIDYKTDHVVLHTKMFKPITLKNHWWKSAGKRLRPSKDSGYHVCAIEFISTDRKGNPQPQHFVRCLYAPGGG